MNLLTYQAQYFIVIPNLIEVIILLSFLLGQV